MGGGAGFQWQVLVVIVFSLSIFAWFRYLLPQWRRQFHILFKTYLPLDFHKMHAYVAVAICYFFLQLCFPLSQRVPSFLFILDAFMRCNMYQCISSAAIQCDKQLALLKFKHQEIAIVFMAGKTDWGKPHCK